LVALGNRQAAISLLEAADPGMAADGDAWDAFGFYARQLDRHQLSNTFYRRATETKPGDPQFWYNLATSERTLGRLAEAASACERALALDPEMRAAVLLRSETIRATPEANNVEDLQVRLAQTPDDQAALFFEYALGKELHDLGRYDEAFAAFARGASARRRSLNYDVAQDELKLRRIAETFREGACRLPGSTPDRHVFVIGMPRSGTTLTERILGGLPNVRSNNETNNVAAALMRSSPTTGGDVFDRAARADFAAMARDYDAMASGDGFAGTIIEKLPFNYLYVGPILRAFPNAPIVWVRRDPLDTCFAMFRTLFGAAYPFSYSFEDLARYYAAYEALMLHWVGLFPDQILQVQYEALVANPAAIGPGLAAFCGLSWTDEALNISRNASASLTASASQVRGNIYSTSVATWRRYEKNLEPLARLLSQHGVDVKRVG